MDSYYLLCGSGSLLHVKLTELLASAFIKL